MNKIVCLISRTFWVLILLFMLSSVTVFAAMDVTLTWDANQEPDLAGYRVYYGTASGNYEPLESDYATGYTPGAGPKVDRAIGPPITVESNVTEIILHGLNDAKVYYFAIKAFDGPKVGVDSVVSGDGEFSDEVASVGITNITSEKAAGAYKSGEVIDIKLTFSEAVTLAGGNLRITLDATGDTIDIEPFISQSSVSVNYTVGEGDNSSDLNVTIIELTAGTLTGAVSGNNCPLTLPSGKNLADNESIVIDTVVPSSSATAPATGSGSLSITWTASDATSGVASTVLWYKYGSGGTWAVTTLASQTGASGTFSYTPVDGDGTYYFASCSTDNAGNTEAAPSDSGDDSTDYSAVAGDHSPDQAVLSSPDDNKTDVSLTSVLQTNAFSDSDSGDTHAATRWQISTTDFTDTADYVLNIKSSANLISLTAPEFVLNKNTQYYWRAAFYDNNDAASDWSDSRSFTTIDQNLFTDDNSNGIPDDQEVADTVDVNNNGTYDVDEISNNYKSVNSAKGNGQIGVSTADDASATIESIKAVNPDDITDTSGKPDDMVLGLVSLKLNVVTAGDTANVAIYLSEAAPAGAKWYKYNPTDGWLDYSDYATFSTDRKSVILELTDGGYGDADGVENAVIIDPSGFGTPSASSSANGGGCFIATAAFGSPLDKHVDILRHLRDDVLLLNKCGQGFVKAYYRYSPPVADFIRDHDTVRLMVRWSLLPVVGLSWMTLQIGAVPTLLLIFMVLSAGWLFLIKYRVKVQGVGRKA